MVRWRDDPAKVKPMLASLDEPPVAQRGLIYEPKYDGIRALADLRPAHGRTPTVVALYSRNGRAKHDQFPEIVTALERLAAKLDGPVLFDGEIVAINRQGRALGFQDLQGRIHLTAKADIAKAAARQPTALIVFDLLRDGDSDLRGQPLAARRLRLQDILRQRSRGFPRPWPPPRWRWRPSPPTTAVASSRVRSAKDGKGSSSKMLTVGMTADADRPRGAS